MGDNVKARGWSRRKLLATATTLGVTGIGAYLYRQAPSFWRQYFSEFNQQVEHPGLIPDPDSWPDKGLQAAWLGHSTVLLKIDGFTIVTDPVFSTRAGLGLGPVTVGVKRLVAPALQPAQLPQLDMVLLSHAHMDHFDVPSLRRLESRRTEVVTAWETGDLLRADRYGAVRELRWGDRVRVGPATVQAFEVKHWGARMRTDTHRGYNGYLLEAGRYRVLFAGDTAVTDSFARLRDSRPIDLAILPIGAYDPWIRNHCTPEQAWQMGNQAGAEFFAPVHHLTFKLSREPLEEPLERFLQAASGHPHRLAIQRIGGEFRL